MVVVYFALLIVLDACGVALAALTLPGTWLILIASTGYALLTHRHYLGGGTLLILLALAVAAEIGEFALGGAGAKKAGASKWGIFGSLVGAILGGIFLSGVLPIFFPLSTICGICLGSFGGAFAVELLLGGPVGKSLRIGFGAAVGRLMGIVGKFTVALVMTVLSLAMGLPTRQHVTPRPGPTTVPATTRPATSRAASHSS